MNRLKVRVAKLLSKWVHRNDFYGSHPYYHYHILGVRDVARQILKWEYTWKHEVVALLHDSIEDHNVSLKLLEFLFGEDVKNSLQSISRMDGESYKQYLKRCKKDVVALQVKRADVVFNLSECVSQGNTKRGEKYLKALEILED